MIRVAVKVAALDSLQRLAGEYGVEDSRFFPCSRASTLYCMLPRIYLLLSAPYLVVPSE